MRVEPEKKGGNKMKKLTVILFFAVLSVGFTHNSVQAGHAYHSGYDGVGIAVGPVSVFGVPPFFFPPPPPFIRGSVRHHRYGGDCGYYGYRRGHRHYRDHYRYDRRHRRYHYDRRDRDHRSRGRGHRRH